jgi:hypothetical protein
MKINESRFDSVLRIIFAVTLLYLGSGSLLGDVLALVPYILAVIVLLTGVIGFCPLYALFNSRPRQKNQSSKE